MKKRFELPELSQRKSVHLDFREELSNKIKNSPRWLLKTDLNIDVLLTNHQLSVGPRGPVVQVPGSCADGGGFCCGR